ncbi:hypothetical protein PI124_g12277 [Phytophthora idaei]|nr:hypothetical protein PI125_g11735 [Phytophthora idaei]KAG3135259.1 hypothetical protein PI126_g18328 [Phytophthora idaei]KAG3242884.1 hypothetical protein PI124_g12277 [Phytophthora idaei]
MDVPEVLTLLDATDSNESDSSSVLPFDVENELSRDAVPHVPLQQPQLKTKKDRRRKEGPMRWEWYQPLLHRLKAPVYGAVLL